MTGQSGQSGQAGQRGHAGRPGAIVLIGLRGSGKSTVGRAVAGRLGVPFVDLDDRTAELLNAPTAAAAIDTHGFGAFRAAETQALVAALDHVGERGVLALGGGTPTAPGAAEALREAAEAGVATNVYLRVTPGELRSRLAATDTSTRPSLTGAGTLGEIDAVFAERDPSYLALAGCVLECDGLLVDDVVDRVCAIAAG